MNTEGRLTIARPYATAAFEYAVANKALASWESMLTAAATVAKDPAVVDMFTNPDVTHHELYDFFSDVLKTILDPEKQNFLHLLADYQRLMVLPEILELFKTYRAAHEQLLTVEVTSVIPLDEQYKDKFTQALAARLKRQVALKYEIDPQLVGGAMIRIGDTVIDGSIRGKLHRLHRLLESFLR